MENYERLIVQDVPGNTPREKHYNLQRMKQALQFWIHTFETHKEKISCVYDETGERFMPYNQIKQSKEALGFVIDSEYIPIGEGGNARITPDDATDINYDFHEGRGENNELL